MNEKKLEGISDIRDESDKSGMRVVIELKRGEVPEVVLNNLYKQTQLQDTFGMNMVALVDGQPRLLNLKQMLECFLAHRREVVTRRTVFELRKARERGHILEGLAVALSNVDEIIALIKAAPTPADAKRELMARVWRSATGGGDAGAHVGRGIAPGRTGARVRPVASSGYRLSDAQAQRILEMQSAAPDRSRAGQDRRRVPGGDGPDRRPARHPGAAGAHHPDHRRRTGRRSGRSSATSAAPRSCCNAQDLGIEDLITPEDMVVTCRTAATSSRQPLADYRAQQRGGRGKQAAAIKEDDFVDHLFIANTHDYILCFSNRGRVYWLKVYEVPQGTRNVRGKPIVNLFPLEEGEKITAVLPVKEFDEEHFVFMATANGTVKKTPLSDFSNPRKAGIIAVDLDEGDYPDRRRDHRRHARRRCCSPTPARRCASTRRTCGRWAAAARGVRGMRLDEGQTGDFDAGRAGDESQTVLTATENGFGKRTPIADYTRPRPRHPGHDRDPDVSERNGKVVGAVLVNDDDEMMLITTGGVLIRTRVQQIREMGRSTQGVTLINLDDGTKLAGLEKVVEKVDNDEE